MVNLARPTASYHIALLGSPSIATPTGSIPTSKPVVFVAALYLCLNRGRTIRRAHLAALLWPDVVENLRSDRVRWLVAQLKHHGIPFGSRASEIRIDASDVSLDVDALARATSVDQVFGLVGGDVLQGFEPKLSDGMSRWLDDMCLSYRSSVVRSLEGWLSASMRAGDWRAVEKVAELVVAIRSDHKNARRALAEAQRMQDRVGRTHDVRASIRPSRMIGRDGVLARVLDAVEAPFAAPRRVGVAGPPGIGKTRLLDEVSAIAKLCDVQVVRLRCGRGDHLRPLSLAVDLARALLLMRGALGASTESIEVLHRFTGGMASEDESPPDVRRAAIYSALRDVVGALVDEGRLAVLIDDAQWAEKSSWTILAPLFAQDAACWIVAVRGETHETCTEEFMTIFPPDGASHEQMREVHWLAPLEQADASEVCIGRASPRPIASDVLARLVEKTAGVPFIAETIVDHWLATGDVDSIPPSVSRLVHARLDRLSPPAARLLTTIAVLGLDASFSAVEAVATLDRDMLLKATRELETAGITRAGSNALSAHALWAEGILQRTLVSTKRLLHRYAAEWLEHSAMAMDVIDPRQHWALVSHWLDAGELAKASLGLDRAATLLSANGFPAPAAQMLERAAELCGVSETALSYLHRAAELWVIETTEETIAGTLRASARYDVVARGLDPAGFSEHHDVELLAHHALDRRNAEPSEGLRRRACVEAIDATPLHRLSAAFSLFGRFLYSRWDCSTADAIWDVVTTIQATSDEERMLFDLCASEYYGQFMERPDLGLVHAQRAQEAIRRGGARTYRYYLGNMFVMSNLQEALGSIEGAEATRMELLARGQELKNPRMIEMALTCLIGTWLEAGQIREARKYLPMFGRPRSPDGITVDFARMLAWTLCALEEGDAAAARAEFSIPLEAIHRARTTRERARILSVYAHIALLEDDDEAAKELLPRLRDCFTERATYMEHPAYAAAMLLARYEDGESAATFVRKFMALRIERWTPRAELLQFLVGQSSEDAEGAAFGAFDSTPTFSIV